MNKLLVILFAFSVTLMKAGGQDIPANDARLMDDHILKMITFEKEKVTSEALDKVFNGAFYIVTPSYFHNNGKSSCENYKVVIYSGKLSDLEEVDEDKSLPQLFSLLKPGTTIKDENEALAFEAALDAIYPLSWSDEASDKKHFIRDGKWLFLRGDFFGSKKGFIITLDPGKKITAIDYSLKAVEAQQ